MLKLYSTGLSPLVLVIYSRDAKKIFHLFYILVLHVNLAFLDDKLVVTLVVVTLFHMIYILVMCAGVVCSLGAKFVPHVVLLSNRF